MRILLIHQAFAEPSQAGGTRHYEFARLWCEWGHQVTVVAPNVTYMDGMPVSPSSLQQVPGLTTVRVRTPRTLHRSIVWRLVAFLVFSVGSLWAGLLCPRPDVVIGTSPPMFQALSAWVVAATRRRPFVLEIRDLWPDDMVASGVLRPHGLAARAFRRLEAFLYRRARRVVVNSPAFMGYLEQRKGLEPARLACVPNGVDAAMFDPAARGETLRRQWGAEGKVTATYAGALGAANDIPTILRAAQRLQGIPDLQFVLVGGGNRSEEAHKLSAALNLANVTFAGAAPKSLMCEVLAASDICLATLEDNLLFETVYPNKVFDYMAAGRPTVLAVRGAIRGVLVDAQAGIPVPPGDDEALAAAVTKLHGDPVTRQVMGDAGRAYVKRHCRRADHARAFCDILRVVADER